MKKFSFMLFSLVCTVGLHAQANLYTFFVNIVDDSFRLPLIGMANIATGDHNIFQTGVVNFNSGSFMGLQAAAVNIVGGEFGGLQAGVVNYVGGGFGLQASAANISVGGFSGAGFGVVNFTAGEANGLQAGGINYAGKLNGVQVGVINIIADGENALPIGLLNIVLSHGYYAVEAVVSDANPATVSVKMGTSRLYTTLNASYNLGGFFCIGGGLGTIVNISDMWFFNLEVASLTRLNESSYLNTSIEPALGWNILPKMSVIVGPALRFRYDDGSSDEKSLFALPVSDSGDWTMLVGAKVALRYR